MQIYDAPASGWRTLFVERAGEIGKYLCRDQALAGIEIYALTDKAAIFEAELRVYLDAARTGKTLGECGLPAIVRFGDHDHYPYAAFTLPEDYILRSKLKIIGYKKDGDI